MLEAVLVERENRYRARVNFAGAATLAHVPNPGRMAELMRPGAGVWLVAVDRPGRRTALDLIAVELDGRPVCIDNRLGARLARAAIEARAMPELLEYETVEREVTRGDSRLDYRLRGGGRTLWVELKSCTLVVDGQGRFPDAPTIRGARHLRELTGAVRDGDSATALFLIQRPDATEIVPNRATDPAFADALGKALDAGVEAVAYTSRLDRDGLHLGRAVPVRRG